MGMFDSLTCKVALPLTKDLRSLSVKWSDVVFQTKSLNCNLTSYEITKEKTLLEDCIEREYVYFTEDEMKRASHKPWNLIKECNIKNRYKKPISHHGVINFYTSIDLNEIEEVWVEFNAYFSYGKLDKIELFEKRVYEHRSIKMEALKEQLEKEQKTICYKIKKYFGWFWFWIKASRFCYFLSKLFSQIQTYILKKLL